MSTGVAPVLITSALAQGVRAIGKLVLGPRGVRPGDLARELGMPPWKIDRVRQQMRGWSAGRASRRRCARWRRRTQAVKGGGDDPEYALEKAVVTVAPGGALAADQRHVRRAPPVPRPIARTGRRAPRARVGRRTREQPRSRPDEALRGSSGRRWSREVRARRGHGVIAKRSAAPHPRGERRPRAARNHVWDITL